jgi:hypothetical protein
VSACRRRRDAGGGHGNFSAPSARHLERSYARDAIVLTPDQRAAVQEVIAGRRSVHALPRRTAGEIHELADIVNQAYDLV